MLNSVRKHTHQQEAHTAAGHITYTCWVQTNNLSTQKIEQGSISLLSQEIIRAHRNFSTCFCCTFSDKICSDHCSALRLQKANTKRTESEHTCSSRFRARPNGAPHWPQRRHALPLGYAIASVPSSHGSGGTHFRMKLSIMD